jgi:hypothetical protein
MTRKLIIAVLLIAVLALSGCTQNLHGGNIVFQ